MKKLNLLLFVFIIIVSCSKSNDDFDNLGDGISNDLEEEWLIARREIKDGGPGRDGIPSIDNPKFIMDPGVNSGGLSDDDLVIGMFFQGEAIAYPHYILDWHELVNYKIGTAPMTLSYCPLTGTAFAWGGESGNSNKTFGTSGLLYNNNLIMYDRETGSLWSQLKLQCVNGDFVGNRPITYNLVETDWKTWNTLYPNTLVLSEDTGFSRTYGEYPYSDEYKTNHEFFYFRPAPYDKRLPSKKRVYAIIDTDKEVSKVYNYEDFTGGKAIIDTFKDKKYLIVGNEDIINSFTLTEANELLTFQYERSASGGFFKDNLGTVRNVFGVPLSGNIGDYLTPAISVVSYWFAIGAFYPEAEIYLP